MSVFDPLGFLAPFLIRSKILMQEVWVSGIGWDCQLRDDEYVTWKGCYTQSELEVSDSQLHIFCDASPKAFSAVAYLRLKFVDGSIKVTLIGSKSRVAPLKTLSVPRLELQGALLASRLGKLIANEQKIKVNERYLWSDSRIVLLWVKTDPRDYQTFVSHRLAEILDLSDPTEWCWVPSECNPADHATKPKIGSLYKNHRWFNGPEFLGREKDHWPSQDCLKTNNHPTDLPTELKKVHSVLVTKLAKPNLPDPKRFSKFNRLLRSTAWILVAINKMRYRVEPKMTAEYLRKAMIFLLGEIQNDCYKSKILALSRQESVDNRSKIRSLTPSIGKDGLLRVRGRVNVPRKLDFEGQPIVIDGAHQITRLILQEYHEKANHGSDNTVLNEIRQKFWVVNARKSLRSISAKC
ncbi:uncharacterized protein LOC122506337 [Leptopilina heterotoma]|uniref:uncharacterized protein LOC122506337 n=1 Tax=Leptopilina heterotoma TaxID=63436 RepID=UPI001CA83BB7|nr:uncharacterized protein LOC122506337 [Leptopilina heterotoma]